MFSNVRIGALVVLAVPLFTAFSPEASAQEIRVSWNQSYSGLREIGFAHGYGGGVRYFLPTGVGFGLEYDRLSSSPAVRRTTCSDDVVPDCEEETVDTDTTGDFATFLLMLRGQGDDWGFRLGFGRSAGTLRAVGVGRTTEREADVPAADDEAGALAWNRGADGSVIVMEVLRRLPTPGTLPVSLQLAFRRHSVRMGGCLIDAYSPFCGNASVTELQAGLHVGLRPLPRPRPEP